MATLTALLALLATLGLSAPAARAEVSNPFPGVTPESETEAEAEAEAQSTEEGGESSEASGTSDSILFIAGGIALVLVLVIGYVIVRDARGRAPTEDPIVQEERSSHDRAVQMRKRRAKAKRARQQRKQNR